MREQYFLSDKNTARPLDMEGKERHTGPVLRRL
jgi:hypothetical protein